jgi:hypothetical protein
MLRVGALGWGGLTLPGLIGLGGAAAGKARTRLAARARSVIILYLSGGPSQLAVWSI